MYTWVWRIGQFAVSLYIDSTVAVCRLAGISRKTPLSPILNPYRGGCYCPPNYVDMATYMAQGPYRPTLYNQLYHSEFSVFDSIVVFMLYFTTHYTVAQPAEKCKRRVRAVKAQSPSSRSAASAYRFFENSSIIFFSTVSIRFKSFSTLE